MNPCLRGWLALTLLLGACGNDSPLPPARPLNASADQLAAIPALQSGRHAVLHSEPVDWAVADRRLRLRAVQPAGDGPFPLVLFSHGFASDISEYDALLDHWASHGYIVLAPFHRDGGGSLRAIWNSIVMGKQGLIAARAEDLRLLLDHLPEIDRVLPGLSRRVDASRIAAAGHSFGAFSAQQLIGAVALDPDTGETLVAAGDARVRAVVAISPPGRMFGLINERSWLAVEKPQLITTGTWDVDGRFVKTWREHALSHDTAKPGLNWLLVVEGADHYLGNLICRTGREAAPQRDALAMVNALAVNFLDAFVKDDADARAFLASPALAGHTGGFATLSQR